MDNNHQESVGAWGIDRSSRITTKFLIVAALRLVVVEISRVSRAKARDARYDGGQRDDGQACRVGELAWPRCRRHYLRLYDVAANLPTLCFLLHASSKAAGERGVLAFLSDAHAHYLHHDRVLHFGIHATGRRARFSSMRRSFNNSFTHCHSSTPYDLPPRHHGTNDYSSNRRRLQILF